MKSVPLDRSPLRVLVACSGLGHITRGFETFSREAAQVLRNEQVLDVSIAFASGRRSGHELLAPAFRRNRKVAGSLASLIRREPYAIEQASYSGSLAIQLFRKQPDVVYFSDWLVGKALGKWRSMAKLRYALVLCNGAAGTPPFHPEVDHVQHPTPVLLEAALQSAEPASRHSMLPLGLRIEAGLQPLTRIDQVAIRGRLHLPPERRIVLSVAALNKWSKRIDYLIRETAALSDPPFVVLLGEFEDEADELLSLARNLLGESGFTARTVRPEDVGDYYRAADVMALTSTTEGFGRVLVEALAQGLPVIAHDYPVTKFVTGPHGRLADLRQPGSLTRVLKQLPASSLEDDARAGRHRFAYDNFSWDVLAPAYVDMLKSAARIYRTERQDKRA